MTGPYPPPSDKPNDGGWPGGDINSPFGFNDPTSPMTDPPKNEQEEPSPYEGVQYELEAPGGPPPQQHPGYAPPAGPVSSAPMTGPPMTGPPTFQQPPPHGYGQPPPFGQPGQPSSGGSGGSGWLIGGVIAGVLVLLAVAAIVVVITVNGTDDTNNPGDDTASGDTDPSGDEGDPGEDDTDSDWDGGYAASSGVCSGIDLTKFTEQDNDLTSVEESSSGSTFYCEGEATYGALYISIGSYTDPSQASDEYVSTAEIWLSGKANIRNESGSWDEAQVGEGEDLGTNDISMTMVARAENLVVMINFYSFGSDTASQQGGIEAAMDCVEQIMVLSRA